MRPGVGLHSCRRSSTSGQNSSDLKPRRARHGARGRQAGVVGHGPHHKLLPREDAEVAGELSSIGQQFPDDVDGGGHFRRLDVLAGKGWIFEFVASAAKRVDLGEVTAELGTYRGNDREMSAGLSGSKTLLGEQPFAHEPGGVVEQDKRRLGVVIQESDRGLEPAFSLGQPRLTVCARSGDRSRCLAASNRSISDEPLLQRLNAGPPKRSLCLTPPEGPALSAARRFLREAGPLSPPTARY